MKYAQQNLLARSKELVGVLIGFSSEDDWIDYRLEHDPRFLARIAQARASYRTGFGVKIEDVAFNEEPRAGEQ